MTRDTSDDRPDARSSAGDAPFEPRVAVASLSGASDADWARAVAGHVGCAFLGGLALDEPTRAAARDLVDRDREEFLPPDPHAFLDRQLEALADVPLRPAFNVRSASTAALEAAAERCRRHGAVCEINAHCRQAEMCDAGAGESLLHDLARLREQVAAATATGATVSVKVRAEVPGVDLPALAADVDDAGADLLHVDAMDDEPVVGAVADATDAAVIANNGVRDAATTREYLSLGADAVSVGRASDDPSVLAAVRAAVDAWFGREVRP